MAVFWFNWISRVKSVFTKAQADKLYYPKSSGETNKNDINNLKAWQARDATQALNWETILSNLIQTLASWRNGANISTVSTYGLYAVDIDILYKNIYIGGQQLIQTQFADSDFVSYYLIPIGYKADATAPDVGGWVMVRWNDASLRVVATSLSNVSEADVQMRITVIRSKGVT